MGKGRKCPKCGKIENEFTFFCTECGTKTVEDVNSSPVNSVAITEQTEEVFDSSAVGNDYESASEEEMSNASTKEQDASNAHTGISPKLIGYIAGAVSVIAVIVLIIVVANRDATSLEDKADDNSVEYANMVSVEDDNVNETANSSDEYNESAGYADTDDKEVTIQYEEEIYVPDWYLVNGVAVNGNELCFSRDDGLQMGNGEYPLTVQHYIFNEEGSTLISLKEYIIFQNELSASQYADELNMYNSDGRNNFGMLEGETYYYNVGNILVEEFLPLYTDKKIGTLQEEISMYAGYGWAIEDVSDNYTGDQIYVDNMSEELQENESFYGIWCGAAKELSGAEDIAAQLQSKGFEADIFVTTDWDNLNDEKWYVVSAGKYHSEDDANNMLEEVKKVYSSAYIKFSGNHR